MSQAFDGVPASSLSSGVDTEQQADAQRNVEQQEYGPRDGARFERVDDRRNISGDSTSARNRPPK